MSEIKQREIIVEHRYLDGEAKHIFDNENYELLELERQVYINENKRLNSIINNIADYVNKMGFGSIVDNPKKDLVKILKKEE